MFISISLAEKKEQKQDKIIAKNITSLRQALKSNCAKTVALALHKWELPNRTEKRFEYTIEWGMLGTEKVLFWKQVKELYYA